MDTSAFSNDHDHEEPMDVSDDDKSFILKSQETPLGERDAGRNHSVMRQNSQPSPFLNVKKTIFQPIFRFLSGTATPPLTSGPTPSAFLSHVSSPAQTVKVFKVPENVKMANEKGVRILAVDNGGICTFSTLYMLEVVMLQVGNLLGVPEGEEVRPCDVFDLICGTSTGGWIALMLGRLGMTVRESISAYEQIVQSVFPEKARLSTEASVYSAERLETVFHEIIARHAPSSASASQIPMNDEPIKDRCRTFVLSRYESDAVVSTEMRTYHVPAAGRSAALCTVWEAARATSSAPGFFPPIVIDKTKYVAIGNNNPAITAIEESQRIWGEGSQIACLVSLGSGIAPAVKWGQTESEIEVAVKAIVHDCSHIADQLKMRMQHGGLGHRYHRFSVYTMGDIKWEEWERTEDVVGRTRAYMEVMGFEARNAAEFLVQVCSERIAVRRRLPLPPPGSCFAREDEIQRAREAILDGRHVAIVGGAGNGKTTVALDTVHLEEVKRFFTDLTRGTGEDLRYWVRSFGPHPQRCLRTAPIQRTLT
ncbi:FabD/lysophospholipase-like protein [Atractiella rhizophila]|nr:FabD/lysophospholipase-like protein [Atractiella rhizophila]